MEQLENFDLSNLDIAENMLYKHCTIVSGCTKSQALQIIINTVEGDFSQLSPELAEIAEWQENNSSFVC